MNIFREVADVQTADMLDLDVPALRGGKPIIVESEPDWYVKQVMEDFVVRAERIRGGGVDPSEDNFLKITHEARLLGTDARLIDKDAPNNPDGKLNKVAENVWKEYEKGNANGHIGCQLIFSDIGTPGPDKDFTIYDYLKETLIQYGIPAEEIAFIHDAKTDAQRDALFKEMRTGKKKVLMPDFDVTIVYEGNIETQEWLYYEQDGMVVTLGNWLNGRLSCEQIEQLWCDLIIPKQNKEQKESEE